MKFCWETHEHCTLGLCRFVKIPFQISWKLHSHIGLKEQTQSFPTLCKGGVAKTKKTSKKKIPKKTIFRESWLGPPPFQRVWIFCFLLFIFSFFRCFFLGFASPPCRCVGKDGFRSYGSAVFVLMVLFLVRWECSLCSQIGAYLSEKLDSQGFPFCCFFGGALPHILVYRGRLYLPYTCISRR